jgi:hypothetical protein
LGFWGGFAFGFEGAKALFVFENFAGNALLIEREQGEFFEGFAIFFGHGEDLAGESVTPAVEGGTDFSLTTVHTITGLIPG